ncbi:hypothetical protein [Azoarcus sp. DN11]|uniref:hypothetical protein n=1 Tax=Azoarcus sp. DN11 TaxID=356837 RepID=UPI000EB4767F|nr:hypothetical protein [Azoarcus sp. DN11]AYH46092.1 hypothetical protein CDA09_22400 [Azoarcus sp. DN11]
MEVLTALAMMVVSYTVAYLTRPKPTKPKPASLSEFDLPVAEEGTPQCVIFGDVWTGDWQVLSYGNFRTRPIKTSNGK